MSDAYVGEIRLFAGNFAPNHWMLCYGQIMQIMNEQALYSLLGTSYGGDGRSSFGIPDFRGRVPVHQGNGPGLTPRPLGQKWGQESVHLSVEQIPSHTHNVQCSTSSAMASSPGNTLLSAVDSDRKLYDTDLTASQIKDMASASIASAGGGIAHHNMMPSLGVNFIICRLGDYPQRS